MWIVCQIFQRTVQKFQVKVGQNHLTLSFYITDNNIIMLMLYYYCIWVNCQNLFLRWINITLNFWFSEQGKVFSQHLWNPPNKLKDLLHKLHLAHRLGEHSRAVCWIENDNLAATFLLLYLLDEQLNWVYRALCTFAWAFQGIIRVFWEAASWNLKIINTAAL